MAIASSGRPQLGGLLARGFTAARTLAPFYVANLLTCLRLASVGPIGFLMFTGRPMAALWLFAAAAMSDLADGFVAKRLSAVTQIGAVLDPIADKLLVGAMFVLLTIQGVTPAWLVGLVLLRDAGLVLGATLLPSTRRAGAPRPLLIGKLSTFVQFAYLAAALWTEAGASMPPALLPALGLAVASLAVASAVAYGWAAFGGDRSA